MRQPKASLNLRSVPTLLFAVALAGCGGTAATASPSAGSPVPTGTAVASVPPSTTPSAPQPSASSPASTNPPSVAPSPAGFSCGATLHLDGTSTDFRPVQVTDVRVGTHVGYDRIVVEFAGTGTPGFDLATASPPFKADPSDLPLTVAGTDFLKLTFVYATAAGTWSGASTFSPGYRKLESVVAGGDFEGHFTWFVGLTGPACYKVSVLGGPTRIVIDLQTP